MDSWTPHFPILGSTLFHLDSTFWLDSTRKLYCGGYGKTDLNLEPGLESPYYCSGSLVGLLLNHVFNLYSVIGVLCQREADRRTLNTHLNAFYRAHACSCAPAMFTVCLLACACATRLVDHVMYNTLFIGRAVNWRACTCAIETNHVLRTLARVVFVRRPLRRIYTALNRRKPFHRGGHELRRVTLLRLPI